MNIKKLIKEELREWVNQKYLLDLPNKERGVNESVKDFDWAEKVKPYTEAEQWFKDLLNQMTRSDDGKYFKINGNVFMIYNEGTGVLLYSYGEIYLVLKSEYGLNNQEINDLIKGMVEQHFNLRGITPIKSLDVELG